MNNPVVSNRSNDQWLSDIYIQEYRFLIMYAFKVIRNEVEAEEIVGKSFEKFAKDFIHCAEKFPTLAHAKAYLATMVRNACYNWLRKSHPVITGVSAEDIADESFMIAELEKYHLAQQLLSLMDRLPSKSRDILILSFMQGLSMEEIAQKLGSSVNNISVSKHRAIKHLRQMMVAIKLMPFPEEII